MDLTPAEQLAHSTVRIECDLDGGVLGTGTGFFYSLNKKDDQHVPVIITNKHVIEGASKGRFILTLQDSDGGPNVGSNHGFEIDNFQSFWRPHPDTSVDLCAMPIAHLIRLAEQQGKQFFYVTFDKSLIPTASEIDDMMGMERITMVGYPNGLWDQVNNLPIFRQGVLASNYKRDWNGKKEFLIDAACFPGSSGSPVMLFDIGSHQTKKGNFFGSSRIKLLGVLYAGPQHTVEGEIKVEMVPTQQKAVSIAGIPNNLGIIIKSERLLDFESVFA
jgi:V8-like Glu-specific endopeptidase